MTVKELISRLQKLDQNMKVFCQSEGLYEYREVDRIVIDEVEMPDEPHDGDDEDEPNYVEVVILNPNW